MAYHILFMVEKTRSKNLYPIFASCEWWIALKGELVNTCSTQSHIKRSVNV